MKPSYLIRPDTLDTGKPSDTPAHFYVLMGGVHLLQTLPDVGYHPLEDFAAHDDPWAPHAEVLPRLKGQFTQLIPGPHASLTKEDGLTAVETAQEALQLFTLDVHVIICPHKPLIFVQVMIMHVFKHHEGLFLWWIRIVHIPKSHYRNRYGGIRASAGKELHTTRNRLCPRPINKHIRRNGIIAKTFNNI